MNIRTRIAEIVVDLPWQVDPYAEADAIADAILGELWPLPKEFYDCYTLTDGTVIFEPKAGDDRCGCGYCG